MLKWYLCFVLGFTIKITFLSNAAQFNHNRHKVQVVKMRFCGYLTVFCFSMSSSS